MRYRTIVADPPWAYPEGFAYALQGKEQSSRPVALPYPSLSVRQICELRVNGRLVRHLSEEDSRLFIWTTNKYLFETKKILTAWDFTYKQTITWKKLGCSPFTGSVCPIGAEFLLVCVRGRPPVTAKWWHTSSVIDAPVTEHSAKPEVFLDLVEHTSPGPYIELFSRRNRLGWDTWGNEAVGSPEIIR